MYKSQYLLYKLPYYVNLPLIKRFILSLFISKKPKTLFLLLILLKLSTLTPSTSPHVVISHTFQKFTKDTTYALAS